VVYFYTSFRSIQTCVEPNNITAENPVKQVEIEPIDHTEILKQIQKIILVVCYWCTRYQEKIYD